MRDLEPYTLEWWLDLFRTTCSISNWYLRNEGFSEGFQRYYNLHEWIEERINDKYGE